MSGKILIVDQLATNRIVLKVKLSAAYFTVVQATTAGEALQIAALENPIMVVANTEMPDMETPEFIKALRAVPGMSRMPIVLVSADNTFQNRVRALEAGANDVIARPFDEKSLLARLRALLRQFHNLEELRSHIGTTPTLGFADAQGNFRAPAKITCVATGCHDVTVLRSRLERLCRHRINVVEPETPPNQLSADLFLLVIHAGQQDAGLHLLAELRASPETRNSGIIAVLDGNSTKLATTLLDMGANDVLCGPVDVGELSIRISNQIHHKREVDCLRERLHDGARAALVDPLTGLYNRRYALPYLANLAGTETDENGCFAVMVADLDHFKQINDTYGHAVGDQVLKHVASLLTSNLREQDMVARIGGEEFLIVLPRTTKEQACQHANHLRRLIRHTPITAMQVATPISVTISIGISLGRTNFFGTGLQAETLLDQADQALYAAKAKGRNTIRLSTRSAA